MKNDVTTNRLVEKRCTLIGIRALSRTNAVVHIYFLRFFSFKLYL